MAIQGPGHTDYADSAIVFSRFNCQFRAASQTGYGQKLFTIATEGPSQLIPGHRFTFQYFSDGLGIGSASGCSGRERAEQQ